LSKQHNLSHIFLSNCGVQVKGEGIFRWEGLEALTRSNTKGEISGGNNANDANGANDNKTNQLKVFSLMFMEETNLELHQFNSQLLWVCNLFANSLHLLLGQTT